jgi:hypothetical protein
MTGPVGLLEDKGEGEEEGAEGFENVAGDGIVPGDAACEADAEGSLESLKAADTAVSAVFTRADVAEVEDMESKPDAPALVR